MRPHSPSILTYHKIGRQFELGVTTVSRDRFSSHMDHLRALGMTVATATQAVRGGAPGLVAVTFDDGYASIQTDALPEMVKRGIAGTVFPVVGHVGKFNTWDVRLSNRPFKHLSWRQIQELAEAGFEVGSHTLTHRDLTRLSRARLRDELRTSKKMIEDALGRGVGAVSSPFGRCSARVIDEAVEAGYEFGFVSRPVAFEDPMRIGRMSVYALDGNTSLSRKLRVRGGYRIELVKNTVIAGMALGTTLVKR
jgi:peptidoglycan/xylan/chitin deacetylase (PgdA/CDA1 family)